MKWIKYEVYQSTINKGTESLPIYEDIFLEKRLGYNETNLSIAREEAYNGKYTIEDDGITHEPEPISIENGGTGACNLEDARTNLGISSVRVDTTINSWGKTVQFSNSAITATCPIEILPGNEITLDQIKELQKAQIVGSAQENGKLTLKCLGPVPSMSIPVTFIIRRDL